MAKALRVHFRSSSLDEFARDHLDDLGEQGIFVRTRQLLPPGTRLELDLRLADGSPVLAGRGTVLYSTEELADLELPAGMEIRLEELTPETARIHHWLLARRARRAASAGARRFRDTLPGLGGIAPRSPSIPAVPEPAPAVDAGGENFCTRGTDPDLEEASASNPGGLPVFVLPATPAGERVELVPVRR